MMTQEGVPSGLVQHDKLKQRGQENGSAEWLNENKMVNSLNYIKILQSRSTKNLYNCILNN